MAFTYILILTIFVPAQPPMVYPVAGFRDFKLCERVARHLTATEMRRAKEEGDDYIPNYHCQEAGKPAQY